MIFTIKTQFNAATALSPQEAFRAKIVTPQRFLHELADFMSLMFGESLSGYIQKDDSSFCRKLNQPREIRYKRLVSVLRAYNLFMETVRHPQILRFVNGDFFNTGQITEDEARDRIVQVCRMGNMDEKLFDLQSPDPLRLGAGLFRHLFEYRFALYQSMMWGSGYLSGGFGLSMAYAFSVGLYKEYLQPMIARTDSALMCLMGEDVEPLVIGDLIDLYDYPATTDDELMEIDCRYI